MEADLKPAWHNGIEPKDREWPKYAVDLSPTCEEKVLEELRNISDKLSRILRLMNRELKRED